MNTSKQILELEKRKERSKDVITRLTSSYFSTEIVGDVKITTRGFNFDVYTNDQKEKVKYIGKISQNHLDDRCICDSFTHGNSENYQKENPIPYQCKHIIAAHSMTEGYW